VIIGTCHRFPPKRMDLVTFDFLSPFVVSKRVLRPFSVHSKVMLDDSEYSDSNSMFRIQTTELRLGGFCQYLNLLLDTGKD
jgi:hypothetical protein